MIHGSSVWASGLCDCNWLPSSLSRMRRGLLGDHQVRWI